MGQWRELHCTPPRCIAGQFDATVEADRSRPARCPLYKGAWARDDSIGFSGFSRDLQHERWGKSASLKVRPMIVLESSLVVGREPLGEISDLIPLGPSPDRLNRYCLGISGVLLPCDFNSANIWRVATRLCQSVELQQVVAEFSSISWICKNCQSLKNCS